MCSRPQWGRWRRHFEYIEVANPGATDISLEGVQLSYSYVDSNDRTRDVPLAVPEGTVVAAGDSIVLWLSYETCTVKSFERTEQEFRDHWGAAGAPTGDYTLVRRRAAALNPVVGRAQRLCGPVWP